MPKGICWIKRRWVEWQRTFDPPSSRAAVGPYDMKMIPRFNGRLCAARESPYLGGGVSRMRADIPGKKSPFGFCTVVRNRTVLVFGSTSGSIASIFVS